MATATAPLDRAKGPVTLSAWSGKALHVVTCPTGFTPTIRFPDLSALIRSDTMPEGLRAIALRTAFDDLELTAPSGEVTGEDEEAKRRAEEEQYKQAKDLVLMLDTLLVEMIVKPKLTLEEVSQIPGEDRDFLLEIAQRQRHTDALGVRLGVAPLSAFREFRELHGCEHVEPPGCEACAALQQQFSTADLGGV